MTWADPRLRAAPMAVVDVPTIVADGQLAAGGGWDAAPERDLQHAARAGDARRRARQAVAGRPLKIRRAASVTMTPNLTSVTVHVGL